MDFGVTPLGQIMNIVLEILSKFASYFEFLSKPVTDLISAYPNLGFVGSVIEFLLGIFGVADISFLSIILNMVPLLIVLKFSRLIFESTLIG